MALVSTASIPTRRRETAGHDLMGVSLMDAAHSVTVFERGKKIKKKNREVHDGSNSWLANRKRRVVLSSGIPNDDNGDDDDDCR